MTSALSSVIDASSPFGNLLRQYRLAAGLTQEELAERAGLSARAISDLERGERRAPYPHTVSQLGRALRLSAADRDRLVAACPRRLSGLPPERTDQDPPTNLPPPLTSFVGREHELAEVRRRLDAARLVTLTGPGGVGKTRLALEATRAGLADYPDGVWLVELASLADPALVPQAVARILGVREQSGQMATESLMTWLAGKQLLLVLDNCEHLVDASAMLVERLLLAAPRLRVLATSRESLGVAGEQVWPVPSLAVPEEGPLPPIEGMGRVAAVRLFIERARLAAPSFTLAEHNAVAVAAICRQLDGLPLAIELAAARVVALPPPEIAARLDGRFQLLTGGNRTAPPRQQTLRATLDWSWELLATEERRLLGRLAVFAGGFTLAAAEVVGRTEDEATDSILDVLARLIEKSLAQVEERAETARYRLLETVRQYASRRLREAGETTATQRRHAAWCLALAEQAEPALDTRDQLLWLAQLDAEQDNLRAALAWSLDHDPTTNLRLAAAMTRYWLIRGRSTEGREWLERRLARSPESTTDWAKALWCAGQLASEQADYAIARVRFEESLRLHRAEGDARLSARSLGYLASMAAGRGDSLAARPLLEEALALIRTTADRYGLAQILWDLSDSAHEAGDAAQAAALEAEALTLTRQLGERVLLSGSLWRLGIGALERGDLDTAQALHEEGLPAADEIGAPRQMAMLRMELGITAYARGDLVSARGWFESALAVAHAVDDHLFMAWPRCYLGRVALLEGDLAGATALLEHGLATFTEAQKTLGVGVAFQALGEVAWANGDAATAATRLRESLVLWRTLGDRRRLAGCLEWLATVAAGMGEPERAARLLGTATALREAIGALHWPIEEPEHQATVEATRAALGDAAFASAWEAGRATPSERVVAEELMATAAG